MSTQSRRVINTPSTQAMYDAYHFAQATRVVRRQPQSRGAGEVQRF